MCGVGDALCQNKARGSESQLIPRIPNHIPSPGPPHLPPRPACVFVLHPSLSHRRFGVAIQGYRLKIIGELFQWTMLLYFGKQLAGVFLKLQRIYFSENLFFYVGYIFFLIQIFSAQRNLFLMHFLHQTSFLQLRCMQVKSNYIVKRYSEKPRQFLLTVFPLTERL